MNSQEIIDARSELSRELNKCRQDAEHFERISKARKRFDQINAELAKLERDYLRVTEEERKAEREANAKRLQNVRITSSGSLSMTAKTYTVSFEAVTYDTNLHGSVWQPISINGLDVIANSYPHVMEYILDRPELIPPEIRALSPNNANEAMDRYFHARRYNSIRTGTVRTFCP